MKALRFKDIRLISDSRIRAISDLAWLPLFSRELWDEHNVRGTLWTRYDRPALKWEIRFGLWEWEEKVLGKRQL